MQHVEHDDVGQRARTEGKLLAIGDQVEPRRELDVRRNQRRDLFLEIANAAAQLQRDAVDAGGSDPIEHVVVDGAQDRLAVPNGAIVRKSARHAD